MRCLVTLITVIAITSNINAQESALPTYDQQIFELIQPVDYLETYAQKEDLNDLLDNTRSTIRTKMKKAKHVEDYSRILMRQSYDFAEEYVNIFNRENVAFSTVTSVSAFMGCWSETNYKNPERCWDKHIYKVDKIGYINIEKK